MLISTQEIIALFLYNLWNLVHIFWFSMLAFGLPTKSLLAKAYTFCTVVNSKLLNFLTTFHWCPVFTELIISIFGVKHFSCNFLNCWIKVHSSLQFLLASMVILWNTSLRCTNGRWLSKWRQTQTRNVALSSSNLHGLIFVQILITSVDWHWFNLGEFYTRPLCSLSLW